MTREQWLSALTEKLRPDFKRIGFSLPRKLRASVGWPLGRALPNPKGSRTIGQCFSPDWSASRHHEVFVSPCLGKSMDAAQTLVHELVHSAVGVKCGHRGQFKRVAIEIGLTGPMRATKAGRALKERLNTLIKSIGRYPHSKLDVSKRKKQGTRMIKLECLDCGYVVRTTQKWLDVGRPTCVCGSEFTEN